MDVNFHVLGGTSLELNHLSLKPAAMAEMLLGKKNTHIACRTYCMQQPYANLSLLL